MELRVKKKLLSDAFKKINQVTSSFEEAKDTAAVKITASEKGIIVGTTYAECKIREAEVKEPGSVLLDKGAFSRAIAVSGDKFTLKSDTDAAVKFSCGRARGPIAITAAGYTDAIMKSAPKSKFVVECFGELLKAMKISTKEESDRTLHTIPGKGLVRGESSDRVLGITVEIPASEAEGNSSSLSIDPKVCDTLSTILGPETAKVGYDDDFISILAHGFRCLIPTLSTPPLEIKEQMDEWFKEQTNYGDIVVEVAQIKSALSNAATIVGKDVDQHFDLTIPGKGAENTAKVSGRTLGGDVDITFEVENSTLESPQVLQIDGDYFLEALSHYKWSHVRLQIMESVVSFSLVEPTETIQLQNSCVPLREDVSSFGGDTFGEEEDFED